MGNCTSFEGKSTLKFQELLYTVTAMCVNHPMAKGGGGGGGMPPPAGSSSFSQESEELSFQTKFLAVVLSFGHLSIKKFFRSDLPSWL